LPAPTLLHSPARRHRRQTLHARIALFAWIVDMDIERINAIGTLLADLQNRTEQLRGYL
jgi:hypothetical protein